MWLQFVPQRVNCPLFPNVFTLCYLIRQLKEKAKCQDLTFPELLGISVSNAMHVFTCQSHQTVECLHSQHSHSGTWEWCCQNLRALFVHLQFSFCIINILQDIFLPRPQKISPL